VPRTRLSLAFILTTFHRTYHLGDLLESPVLNFWKEEVDPESSDDTAWKPYVSISRTPVERLRVDEVWGSTAKLSVIAGFRIALRLNSKTYNVVSQAKKKPTAAARPKV
jgi:hypothetical protein